VASEDASAATLQRGVWQRIVSGREAVSTAPPQRSSPADMAGVTNPTQDNLEMPAHGLGAHEGRSRRRRRPRYRRRYEWGSPIPAPASDPLPGTASSSTTSAAEQPPPCVVDWSEQVATAEADLAEAVIVTVIGDGPLATVEDVAAVIAPRIAIEAESLVLRRASPSSYLLVLPDMALVDRLVGLQQPVRSPSFNFSLLCKRWNRLAGAHARVLPFLLDVELRGIPAHVWETSTVERLLSPHDWVQQVHPDTLALSDLSCFRCLGWSTDPSALPSARELWVVEPPMAAVEDPPLKRVLAYPVKLKYSDALRPAPSPPPSSDEGNDSEDDSTRWRRRIRSPSPSPRARPASVADQASGQAGSQFGSVCGQVRSADSPAADSEAKESSQERDLPSVEDHAVLIVVHGLKQGRLRGMGSRCDGHGPMP